MSFPTCPSCKQSVLDDDAVDCPFCGASMKGKPGASKPAASAPAAVKPPASGAKSVPAPRSAGRAPTPLSSTPANSFDASPFDLNDDLSPQVTVLSRVRSKSKPLAVKCPMCETVGYATPDDAGKSVKCANPQCMVPVFTAPRQVAEKKKTSEPQPVRQKSNILGVGGVTLAVVAVIGGLVWWIAGRPNTESVSGPTAEDLALVKSVFEDSEPVKAPATKPQESQPKPENGTKPKVKPAAAGPKSYAAMLKVLHDASLQRDNRSKPFSRRLSAEGFALAGDLPGAMEQLDGLKVVGAEVPYYRVTPLVQIAWQKLSQGDRPGAVTSADEAWNAAQSLPTNGRDRLETAIELGAILVALDRPADAQQLLAKHQSSDPSAQLAMAHCAVQSLGTFDLADFQRRRPAHAWSFPLTVGVVYELVGHGQEEAARQWAEQLSNLRERVEALSVWGEAVVWKAKLDGKPIPFDELRAAAQSVPSPGNVLALTRLGLSLSLAGDAKAATTCETAALEELAKWEPVSDVALPEDLKELSQFKAPAFDVRSLQVAANGEAAHLAAQLGQTEKANELLSQTLARARAIAPGPSAVQDRRQQIRSGGIAALRARLKTEWNLKTDNQALVAANSLQKNLDELAESAQRRVDHQLRILDEAVSWGLAESVWAYLRGNDPKGDDLFDQRLPVLVAEALRATGKTELADEVAAAWKQKTSGRSLPRSLAARLEDAGLQSASASRENPAQVLKEFRGDPTLDGLVLRGVCRETAAGRAESAFKFSSRLSDPVLKEECYLLIAALSARKLDTRAAEKHLEELSQGTDKVALARGLIAGWVAGNRSKPQAATE